MYCKPWSTTKKEFWWGERYLSLSLSEPRIILDHASTFSFSQGSTGDSFIHSFLSSSQMRKAFKKNAQRK